MAHHEERFAANVAERFLYLFFNIMMHNQQNNMSVREELFLAAGNY